MGKVKGKRTGRHRGVEECKMILARWNSGVETVSDIAVSIGITQSALSHLVARLKAKGWPFKERDFSPHRRLPDYPGEDTP